MPPKNQQAPAKRKRVSTTNKALESRQFSTVRPPRASELPAQKVNVEAMHAEVRGGHRQVVPAPVFDPIPNDPMFYIVEDSTYWPPPSLDELEKRTGISVVGVDGFDSYDRRADDEAAKKEKTRIVKGELNHPRGKPRKNVVKKLSDSDTDTDGESDD